MNSQIREEIRRVVCFAMSVFPNAHLGDYTAREDMRSAFLSLRMYRERGFSWQEAVNSLERDCYRYTDM